MIVNTITSHQIRTISLDHYIWTGYVDEDVTKAGNWLPSNDASGSRIGVFTVEIAWEKQKGAAALIGWQRIITRVTDEGGNDPLLRGITETQMVKLKQK
ncbi:hypothetical protein ACFLTP_08855 [Chloroflexota bacterium]